MSSTYTPVRVETGPVNTAEALDVKRFYVPGVLLVANCPECGVEVRHDLGRRYLSYPSLTHPIEVFLCHDGETSLGAYFQHEFPVLVALHIEMRPVDLPTPPG